MMAFVVAFLIAMINGYCQSIHILEQGRFSLFLGGNRILDPIGKTLVIIVAQNTIPPT